MRGVAGAIVLLGAAAGPASAQDSGGYSAGPGAQPPAEYETVVQAPSPEWTQDRTFPGTRFWKLDPGRYELELWWRVRDPREEDAYHIVQAEVEIGLTPRIQLDLYENLLYDGEWHHEGNQIEARIAVDPVYGRTPLNPVIYLEWHPRHLDADRAEARLLLGGDLMGPQLVGAVNLFYEQNVTDTLAGYVSNPEAGLTAAVSYALAGQKLRAGAEVKLAFEKETFDDDRWEKQLLAGPNLSSRIAGTRFKVYATVLIGITDDAKKTDSFLILASEL